MKRHWTTRLDDLERERRIVANRRNTTTEMSVRRELAPVLVAIEAEISKVRRENS